MYYEGEKHPHERVMLWPTGPNTWIVGSPDGDEWEEDLSGSDPSSGPLKSAPLTRMGGHRSKDGHRMYRFRAPLSNKSLTDLIGLARDEAVAHESLDIGRPLPLEYVQPSGRVVKLPFEPLVDKGGDPSVGGDHVWLCIDPRIPADSRGEPCAKLPEGGTSVGDSALVLGAEGMAVLWVSVPKDGVAKFLAKLPSPTKPDPESSPQPDDLRDRLGRGLSLTPDRAAAKLPAAEDERTLWIDYDEHGGRFKKWREAVNESTELSWGEEWDLEGGATCLQVARTMDKSGFDPRLWIQMWEREKKVQTSDRTHWELATLVDIMYYAACVDQVNLGGLMCLEVAARRLQQITEAYREGSDRPNWESARHLGGRRNGLDLVAPTLRAFAVARAKEEALIENARKGSHSALGAAAAASMDGVMPAAKASPGKGPGAKGAAGGPK